MDKYEYKVRADEIKRLVSEGDFAAAMEICDTIDWNRVKSVMMLCTVSDIYKINRRYEDSKNILLLAYDRQPTGRQIVYSLCELSIKLEQYDQAVEYYKEFAQLAPRDSGVYILLYKLYESQDVNLEERIDILKKLKAKDYKEKWVYELAYLYHRNGNVTDCIDECDELILWFGEGKYVMKAMELKMLHAALTPEQQAKYDLWTRKRTNTEPVAPENRFTKIMDKPADQAFHEMQDAAASTESSSKDIDIHVKTMDVGQYNTINLQKALAESMKEVLTTDPVEESETVEGGETFVEGIPSRRIDPDASELFFDDKTGEMITPVTGETPAIDSATETAREVYPEPDRNTDAQPQSDADKVMQEMKRDWTQPRNDFDQILSQEYDGQIRLVVPESEHIEKQITGQMSIADIMAEWERMKKENEKKRAEDVRRHVLEQTGNLFKDFDISSKSGLLEQLDAGLEPQNTTDESKTPESEFRFETVEEESAQDADMVFSDIEEDVESEISGEIPQDIESETSGEMPQDVESETSGEISQDVESETSGEIPQDAESETSGEIPQDVESETSDEIPQDATVETPTDTSQDAAAEDGTIPAPDTAQDDAIASFHVTEDSRQENAAQQAEDDIEESEQDVSQEAEEPEIRELTPEEKELFGRFIQNKESRRQIIQTLDGISLAAYTGNVIITGDEGTGTMKLAKNLIREVQTMDHNFSGRVAKIGAAVLNNKDIPETLAKLVNGALIIQGAGNLSQEAVKSLCKTLDTENNGIIILLEGTRRSIERLLDNYPQLLNCFNTRIDIKALGDHELVNFGRKYAYKMEYAIDDMGMLALHTRISERQTVDHAVTIYEVQEIIDEAIAHADRKNVKHFFDILFGKRYDSEDMVILREHDFIKK